MAWLPRPGYSRNPADAVRVVLGGAILAVTTTAIHKDFIGDREAALFRVVNELALPGWTWPGVWLVMQLGVIGAVPLVAILALATRRLRLALDAVLAAGSIYLIAKLVKEFVQRGRPQTLLDGVNILGEPARGLGYVSGHSAVAVALATVARATATAECPETYPRPRAGSPRMLTSSSRVWGRPRCTNSFTSLAIR
jgi:membrane-associated phospholipid phosphatase